MKIPDCTRCGKQYVRNGARFVCPECLTMLWPTNGVLEIDCAEPPPEAA